MKTRLQEIEKFSHTLAKNVRIGIVVSEWNKDITKLLLKGALDVLKTCSVIRKNIIVEWVSGSYELPLSAQFMIMSHKIDAVICLGVVIQGETRHFDYICQSVSQNIAHVGMKHNIPVIFGVLTTDNYQQAVERAGGKHGNKGAEAAVAAIKMIALKEKLSG